MIVDKVSGIGPKIALNLLGSLSLPTLKNSIAHGDVGMLSKAQGLGKKTAERIVVELKDKVLPKGTVSMPPSATGTSVPSGAAGLQVRRICLVMLMRYQHYLRWVTRRPMPTKQSEGQQMQWDQSAPLRS